MSLPLLTFTERKLNDTKTEEHFYVWARSGALVTSDKKRTLQDAQTEMSRIFWQGRKPCIVKVTTTETIIEEGE